MILGPQRPILCPGVIGLRGGSSPSLPTDGGAAIVRHDIKICIRWAREALALEARASHTSHQGYIVSPRACAFGWPRTHRVVACKGRLREGESHLDVTAFDVTSR